LPAHEKGLELTYQVPPGVPVTILGDPNSLRHALLNPPIAVRLETAHDQESMVHFLGRIPEWASRRTSKRGFSTRSCGWMDPARGATVAPVWVCPPAPAWCT
jgi:hypothetical protein